ncbi:putative ABC transport system ATP-binding protein [Lachnospiraceae bacterium C7]|nr:putative ABC transport system ATP-binding protein [Lachnospiraceae bacterium C7]
MIKLEHISKTFKTGSTSQKVLDNVNFQINDNDFITIKGPSGCGKSTLLGITSLLLSPDHDIRSALYYDDFKVNFKKEKQLESLRMHNIGMVFQSTNLISSLSVLENVLLPVDYKIIPRRDAIEKAKLLLTKVGLREKKNFKISLLSGGEAQRVSIVRALMNDPKVLFCDEPTGALDKETSSEILELLLEFSKENNSALVIVTHDNDIWMSGKRKVILEGGRLIENP